MLRTPRLPLADETTIRPGHVLLLLGVAFVWGFNFVVIKVGLESFPPLLFSALRFGLIAFPAVLFVPRPNVPWRDLVTLGLIFGVVLFGLLFVGIHAGVPPGLASLVMQTHVLFTIVLGVVLLGERPQAIRWLAVGLGFAGIALLVFEAGTPSQLWALALVLGGAFAWGISNLLLRRVPASDMAAVMIWLSLVPPVPLMVLSALFEGPERIATALSALSWTGVAAVAYTGFLSTVFAYGAWGAMLRRYPVSVVTPYALLVPIFGLGSAALFLGERFSGIDIAATLLVLLALLVNIIAPKLARASSLARSAGRRPS
ncbi:EamA family transporter [Marinivivus vitaminiproducens]|uniref:EamA family transporter n=1 Tax=Marinivivus vitaminiproducens TaxID=3035935 RepID=UPI0027982820|nr:EamA family transporter [Geminicoccaceae bacterium SCSIO 64248]